MVRGVYCLSFKRNIILWGGFVWWPVSPAGHARSCADTLLRPCVYADMGWWAHADMRWWASRLVGSCADGLVRWWAHADMRWWASRLVGSCGYALVG